MVQFLPHWILACFSKVIRQHSWLEIEKYFPYSVKIMSFFKFRVKTFGLSFQSFTKENVSGESKLYLLHLMKKYFWLSLVLFFLFLFLFLWIYNQKVYGVLCRWVFRATVVTNCFLFILTFCSNSSV